MKISFLVLCFFLISISCNKKKEVYLGESNGGINSVTFVAADSLLQSDFGKMLIDNLGREAIGLSIGEPLFDVHPLSTKVFDGFTRHSRNIVLITIDNKAGVSISKNAFAKPQTIINIKGPNINALSEQFTTHLQTIIDTLTASEEKEKRHRMLLSPNKEDVLEKFLNIQLTLSSVFHIGKPRIKNLFWASRNIKNGMSHLVIYDIPYRSIDTTNISTYITKIRDSIGAAYLPGREPNMHYTTSKIIPSITQQIQINGHKAYQTKGLWEMTNFTMGGPSINYMIANPKNNRYICIEGFVFAPGELKRNYIFEFQTIAKSIKFL